MCLETQFDSVIVDRPMVLQSLYQLHNCLSDRRILTWEFFLNRFDALFLEAQLNLEKSGDIAYLRGNLLSVFCVMFEAHLYYVCILPVYEVYLFSSFSHCDIVQIPSVLCYIHPPSNILSFQIASI